MNVIRVIVDEKPKCCCLCKFSRKYLTGFDAGKYQCSFTESKIECAYEINDDCPVVEQDVDEEIS